MKTLFPKFLALFMFIVLAVSQAYGQKETPLTNQDVLRMVKAGLKKDVIIKVIESSSKTKFDLSAKALIKLKKAGVNQEIIKAMVVKKRPIKPIDYTAVFLIDGTSAIKMEKCFVEHKSYMTLSVWMIFSRSTSSKVYIQTKGGHAHVQLKNNSPFFELYLPDNLKPEDYVTLVKFELKPEDKPERRQVEIVRPGMFKLVYGINDNDKVPVKFSEVRSSQKYKLYRIQAVIPLPPGEYALLTSNNDLYDFGITEPKEEPKKEEPKEETPAKEDSEKEAPNKE